MIARLTRILLLLQIAAAAVVSVCIAKIAQLDSLALAALVGIGSVYLLRMLITANNFVLAWHYRSETPPALRLRWHHALYLFVEEFNATLASTSWSMPFQSFAKRPAHMADGWPVLLIHGYGCNSGYWHTLSKAMTQAGITHHAVDLEPVLGDIDAYVPIVQRAVEMLCKETGRAQIVIVAHSMGGLVARAYLRDHGGARIAKAITLGTPHHGTDLANFGPGINGRQMRRSGNTARGAAGDWLRQLEKSEGQTKRALFVSIFSHHDNIVAPQTSSYLEGARNIEFGGIGHVALALNPRIRLQVLEEIRRTTPQPARKPVEKFA